MSRSKRKKNIAKTMSGLTVAEAIESLKAFPQDAILVFGDGDGGVLPAREFHVGAVYHAHPGAEYIGEYAFVRQSHIDDPLPQDADFFAQPRFRDTKCKAVEIS